MEMKNLHSVVYALSDPQVRNDDELRYCVAL